ncbi:E3 ubiquitin-protein ligase rnf168 [Oryzias melastigma]|uniref:RING-type E3 ubiquitin transferase n=1 Tax=Oryzias melastigma TaxID=30732 RepID=A0A3B3CD09_ORYME|nr:E3 ubiquitin-protein ligase rnf168 [Oryzias melastigma]
MSDRAGGTEPPLSPEDCRCPVCLEILVEPVTLPCAHTFCKSCFLESVDKATLCCPLCRKRVSTWARQHSKNQTLVDQVLWTRIQTAFPLQCQRRLSGQDADDEDRLAPLWVPRVSLPGELRQEYEDQVTKLMEERRQQDEEEQHASEEYIQRLLAEEEELLQQERRRKQEDEQLAQLLSQQLNTPPAGQDGLLKKKKGDPALGQIDRFLSPRPAQTNSPPHSLVFNKENIFVSRAGAPAELHHRHEGGAPCLEEGRRRRRSSEEEDGEGGLSKRLMSKEFQGERQTEDLQRRGQEEELQGRWQQEEEDRRLALLLQKELDQEERRKATDRSKGSSDPYLLRQNRKLEAQRTRRAASGGALRSSTSPLGGGLRRSSSSRGRQTTLTKMFSSLSG